MVCQCVYAFIFAPIFAQIEIERSLQQFQLQKMKLRHNLEKMRLDHEMKKREQDMLKTITDLKAENERLINMTTKDNCSLTKDLEPVPPSISAGLCVLL